jgi:recombination protein RecA
MPEKDNEKKALEMALKQLDKLGITVRRLGDKTYDPLEVIPTGSLGLDIALGVGGYPRGKIIELYGREMSGKSTLSLIAMGNAQKLGGTVALIDAEHSFDPVWATKLGMRPEELLIQQPDWGEQAFETIEKLALSNAVDMIVVDSTAALSPKSEQECDYDKDQMARQAYMMSRSLRKVMGTIGKSKTVLIMINQIRQEAGKMFGNPNTTPGGLALKFYSSVRIEVQRKTGPDDIYKDGETILGHRVHAKIQKNKCAPPFVSCDFSLYFNSGIDLTSEIPDLAVKTGVTQVSGHTYLFSGEKYNSYAAYVESIKNLSPETLSKLKDQIIDVDKKTRVASVNVKPEEN